MPRTILGIGTRYYSKANYHTRHAECPHCHQQGPLLSYDTQLWFVLFLLPLLPLGRKRILNRCPACQHHQALSVLQWNLLKRQQIEDAGREMKQRPNDPLAAIHLHDTLLAFNQSSQAAELLGLLQSHFPDHAPTQAYLRSLSDPHREPSPSPAQKALKPLRAGAAAAMALIAALLFANLYLSHHRTVHLVNGFSQPLILVIDGSEPLTLPPNSHRPIKLREARHRADFSGAILGQLDFSITRGIRERWLSQPVYILNPGGAAILLAEQTVQVATTSPTNALPHYQLHFGSEFLVLPKTDYLFTEFPPELRHLPTNAPVAKTRIDLIRTPPPSLIYSLAGAGNLLEALRVAEWHLNAHPEETDLLPAYAGISFAAKNEAQARQFLAAGAKRRPVEIQWHRFYQELASADHPALIQHYDELLAAEPTNSALSYLRGRLSTTQTEALPFYERALALDPSNAFAHHALGFAAASSGDWKTARRRTAQACQLRPEDDQMQELLFESRLALGEFELLETDLRSALAQQPFQFTLTRRLAEVLVARNKTNALSALVDEHHQQLLAKHPNQAGQIQNNLLSHLAYVQGDFLTLQTLASQDPSPEGGLHLLHAYVERGRFADAQAPLQKLPPLDPLHALAISMAIAAAAQTTLAAQWHDQSILALSKGRPEFVRAATFLERPEPTPLPELLDLSLQPQSKAILALALANRFPQQSATYKTAALALNVHREFPYHLLNRLASTSPTP